MAFLSATASRPSPTNGPVGSAGPEIKRTRIYAILFVVVIIILGTLYLRFAWLRYQHIADSEAIALAQSVEAMMHPEHIALLTGGPEDLELPEYLMAKFNLTRLTEANEQIHFAYLMGQKNGKLIFLVDSEAADSPDYSPPGQVYVEATEVDFTPFRSGETALTPPITDRWGTWISALVPIRDPSDGSVRAVLGIDYSASEWYAHLRRHMIPDVAVISSLLVLFLALLRAWQEHVKFVARSRKLAFDEALYHSVFDQAPIGIAVVRDKRFISPSVETHTSMNPMFERILGRTNRELERIPWTEITHPDDLRSDLERFEQFQKGIIGGYTMEKRFIRPNGSSVWTYMKISPLVGGPGTDSMHLCLLEDISDYKQMEETLRESERSKAVLLSHLPGMAYRRQYDRAWTMRFASEGCLALTGYAPDSLVNNRNLSYNDIISPEYRELLLNEWERVLEQKRHFRHDYEIITHSGERKWVLELGQGIFDGHGNVQALEGIVIDISAQKKREARIAYLTERDFLTGLYNRRYLEKEKERLDRQEFWPLSIVLCDINGLSVINDAYGLAEGDRLIATVAKLIQGCCREGDILGRTGGDEFMLLLPHTGNDAAHQRVKRIQSIIEGYNRAERRESYELSLCFGYGVKESGDQTMEEAIKTAKSYLNHRKLLDQRSSHNAILSSIMATLYAKSQETEEHGQRLTRLTNRIGERLGLGQDVLDDLELLSMLHDIGKVGVDDRILNKPGKLTAEEWEQMKKHSEIGHRIAMSTPELKHIAQYILYHHERWDGTGYPSGLRREEIPLPSRILAVADAFDAMTENRAYSSAVSMEAAMEEIERCSGTQFDPDIARLFVGLMRAMRS